MRKLHLVVISAALVLAWAAPTQSMAAGEPEAGRLDPAGRIDGHPRLAFTLEEMNCFSSDVRALEPAETDLSESDETFGPRVAASGGTNGIPCSPRDPKAPPKKKRTRS